jgi:hypothetical protein
LPATEARLAVAGTVATTGIRSHEIDLAVSHDIRRPAISPLRDTHAMATPTGKTGFRLKQQIDAPFSGWQHSIGKSVVSLVEVEDPLAKNEDMLGHVCVTPENKTPDFTGLWRSDEN